MKYKEKNMASSQTNLKEGYMFVQSTSVWRPWAMKAKYFILTHEHLYCYKRRGDLDSIPCDVIPLNGLAVTLDEEKRGLRKRYYLRMTSTPLRRSWNLFCFMIEERNEWLTAVLTALAGKYTDKGIIRSKRRKSGKTLSLGECEFVRRHQIDSLEQTRPFSISCLELTNLSVMTDPMNPTRSVVPIRKTFNLCEMNHKKISSSSLDVNLIHSATELLIENNNGSNSAPLRRHCKHSKTQSMSKTTHKRHKSMSDLLLIEDEISLSENADRKKRKSKGLSMFGTNLSFVSIANLNRLK